MGVTSNVLCVKCTFLGLATKLATEIPCFKMMLAVNVGQVRDWTSLQTVNEQVKNSFSLHIFLYQFQASC